MTELYTDEPNGLCGNEDCGQMSAWYVFSSMGFYPVAPFGGMMDLGIPQFSSVQISVPGKPIISIATDRKQGDTYVSSFCIMQEQIKSDFH
ncbi:MAG: glycoside hydrolase family 92 protein [Saprospiraceae bacterium]|nr:glycoside hydrolase family 92 protein [Saprospiraceae bacterium]